MDDYRFPDGTTLGKFIGNVVTVNGLAVTITDILSENLQSDFNERRGVFEGVTAQNGTDISNLRYQQQKTTSSLHQSLARVSKENFDDERNALSACQDIDTVPRLFAVDELVQRLLDPFRDEYLRAIVMSRARGESVVEILRI